MLVTAGTGRRQNGRSCAAEKKLRIHYFDRVKADGFIYVGHVGEHLPSASTTKVHR